MTTDKKELAVAALQNGTVIDHIPSGALFRAVRILGIEQLDTAVTIGNNLPSGRLGKKGIIKVADVEFPEDVLNRIAIIAPTAMVNIIRNYEVVEKRPVVLCQMGIPFKKKHGYRSAVYCHRPLRPDRETAQWPVYNKKVRDRGQRPDLCSG